MNDGNHLSEPVLPAPGGLIFDWSASRSKGRLRLLLFLGISAVLHLLFFYLIRVVYPTSERVLPSESRILLLHPSDPVSAPLLSELVDRGATRWSSLTEREGAGFQIEGYPVTYQATFLGHEPALLPWDGDLEDGRGATDIRGAGITLPPPVVSESVFQETTPAIVVAGETGGERPFLSLGGALENRKVLHRQEVDVRGWSGAGGGRAVYMLGVEQSGKVGYSMALNKGDLPDASVPIDFLKGIRFSPGGSLSVGEIVWGTVHLSW